MKTLTPAERLIVAADFKPPTTDSTSWLKRGVVEKQVIDLAFKLKGTGVYLKVNSALRACGYKLIDEIHAYGLKVFADLKLIDIGMTLQTDGEFLREAKPEIVTTVCTTGIAAMRMLKAELPDTEVLGVTVLTNLTDVHTQEMFSCSVEEAVLRSARAAVKAGINGLISAPKELAMLKKEFGDLFSLNTPAIRPAWAVVAGDDQNLDRAMTPAEAIRAGADRIVVGRPITQAENPYDAVMRTLEEIHSAVI